MSKIQYALYKYHFVREYFGIDAIMDDTDKKFLKMLFSPDPCLHPLLPPVKSNPYGLCSRDRNLQLPICNFNFWCNSFIIHSLYLFK